jgi:hypothetical protein
MDPNLAVFYPPNASHAFEGPFLNITPLCAGSTAALSVPNVLQIALRDDVALFFGPDAIERLTNQGGISVSGIDAYSAELNLYALGGQFASLPNAGMKWVVFMHRGRPWVVLLSWRTSAAERDAVEAAVREFRLQ